jgi:hypothetical protein
VHDTERTFDVKVVEEVVSIFGSGLIDSRSPGSAARARDVDRDHEGIAWPEGRVTTRAGGVREPSGERWV